MTYLFVCAFVVSAIADAGAAAAARGATPKSVHRYRGHDPDVYGGRGLDRAPAALPVVLRAPKYRQKYRYRAKGTRPAGKQARLRPPPRRPTTLVTNEVEEFDHDSDFPTADVGSFPTFGREPGHLAHLARKQKKKTTARPPTAWTTPAPSPDAEMDFQPIQMYLQVRQTNKVSHVPQSEAVKDATTLEEVLNAPRLKELLRTTRVREVYTEEGYEDAGYDHGGHIRHAEHDEGYAAKDEGVYKMKASGDDEESVGPEPEETKVEEEPQESRVTLTRSEVRSVEFATLPPGYKGEHKYSSRIRSRNATAEASTPPPFPFKTGERPSTEPSTETKKRKTLKYSYLHRKYPKRDRFRLAKLNENETEKVVAEKADEVPTIGYINSLTTAHFGKGKKNVVIEGERPLKVETALNLTQALKYLRSNGKDTSEETPRRNRGRKKFADDASALEILRLKNRSRRQSDADEGSVEDRERYEDSLSEEIDKEQREVLQEGGFKAFEEEEDQEEEESTRPMASAEDIPPPPPTPGTVDTNKYPFYFSRGIHENSPLRYATNPRNFPRKIGRGMPFYESRERLVQCPEFAPQKDDIPRKNVSEAMTDGELRRINLTEKIACLKAKYFGEDPFDSPIFKEREIERVGRLKPKRAAGIVPSVLVSDSDWVPVLPRPEQGVRSRTKRSCSGDHVHQPKRSLRDYFARPNRVQPRPFGKTPSRADSPQKISRYIQGHNGREMIYVMVGDLGRWVRGDPDDSNSTVEKFLLNQLRRDYLNREKGKL